MSDSPALPTPVARIAISVRWRDMDAFGHVNNAKYISNLEEARVRWLLDAGIDMRGTGVSPVVVNTNVNYRRPIEWPNDVMVELFTERMGTSSVVVGHRIVKAADPSVLYSDGNVTVVWIDIASGKSVPLPDDVRAASGTPLAE